MAVLLAASLSLPAIHAEARGTANQKKATLAGAAAGAALGGLLGNDGQSAIIGAVAGGLAGNAYAYHNKKMNQKDEDIALRDRRYRDSRYYDYDYDRYGYDYGDSRTTAIRTTKRNTNTNIIANTTATGTMITMITMITTTINPFV